jgi:hypothetical protein
VRTSNPTIYTVLMAVLPTGLFGSKKSDDVLAQDVLI